MSMPYPHMAYVKRLALYPKLVEVLSRLVAEEDEIAGAEEIDFHQLAAMREALEASRAVLSQAREIEA